ncbi:hypothetical protein AAHC03_016805 [Spirometra sp. Aus1]
MLHSLVHQKTASSAASASGSVELAASSLICLGLLYLSGLPFASALSKYVIIPTQGVVDISEEQLNASIMLAPQPTNIQHPVVGIPQLDPVRSILSGPKNAAEGRNHDASYLSKAKVAGSVGVIALRNSDVEEGSAQHGSNDITLPMQSIKSVDVSAESEVQFESRRPQDDFEGNTRRSSSDSMRQPHAHLSQRLEKGDGNNPGAKQRWQLPSQKTQNADDFAEEEWRLRSRRAVTSVQRHIWPAGIIPYQIGPQYSSSSKATILSAMRIWESVTCIHFIEREPHHQSFIYFTILPCGCCSAVGRQSENRPQTISVAPSCESEGSVLHELGHVLGLWHEQSRPDRDEYVEILEENIMPFARLNFFKFSRDQVDSLGERYDYNSIMHYYSGAYAIPGTRETIRPKQCCPPPPIGQRIHPSSSDIRQVNKLYNCPSKL